MDIFENFTDCEKFLFSLPPNDPRLAYNFMRMPRKLGNCHICNCPHTSSRPYRIFKCSQNRELCYFCEYCIKDGLAPDRHNEKYFNHNGFYYQSTFWKKCGCCEIPIPSYLKKTVSPYCGKCCDSIGEKLSHQLNPDVSKHISSFI